MINCIILEDEKAAQKVLQSYVDKTPFLNCLGIYESGLLISPEILTKTDLLFLDIQLPEINGLSFIKTLVSPPAVIVTTAFSDYAVEAFEEAVIDYLVKPFSFERFFKAVTRTKRAQNTNQPSEKTHYVYADKTVYKIKEQDILYVKAEVDYVRLVTTKNEILVLDSLKNWTEKLTKDSFVQSHRSFIVNVNAISSVSPSKLNIHKHSLPIGPIYKSKVLTLFNKENGQS